MDTQAVAVQEQQPEPAAEKRLTVFARNPQEMNVAQGQLIKWTLGKLGEIRGEVDELQENLDIAVKNGWRSSTLRRQLGKAKGRVEFYRKVKAALEAGYCIVPNFPIDVFAIRTTRERPLRNKARRDDWTPAISDQRSESPPISEGAYVSPQAEVWKREAKYTDEKKIEHTQITVWAESFVGVDFPFVFAQPEVLHATQQAMVDRVFDELGVSPARGRPRGDPMVIGRIYAPHGTYSRDSKALSFVVAWFLRPDRDLDF